MPVSREVKEVFANFHQDLVYDRFSSMEEMIKYATVGVNEPQRKAVAQFLDELLGGSHDADELQRIWWETSADIFFPDAQQLIAFLQALRQVVKQ
jgi:hypothetical protein